MTTRPLLAVLLALGLAAAATACGGDSEDKPRSASSAEPSAQVTSTESPAPSKAPTKKPAKTPTAATQAGTFATLSDQACVQVSALAGAAFKAPAMQYRPDRGACENLDDSFEGDDVDNKSVHVSVNVLPDRYATAEAYVAALRAATDSGMDVLALDGWSYATRVGSAYTLSRVAGKRVLACSGEGYGSQDEFVKFCSKVRDALLAG